MFFFSTKRVYVKVKNVFLTKANEDKQFFYDETIINHMLPYKIKGSVPKKIPIYVYIYSVFSSLFSRILIVLAVLYKYMHIN